MLTQGIAKYLTFAFAAVVFLAAVLTVFFTVSANARMQSGFLTGSGGKTVIIDPGHGGPDGGAVGVDGAIEKGINLSISLKLRTFFLLSGYKVIMTREDDRSIHDEGCDTLAQKKTSDLKNRLKIMNTHPEALFISIHQNIYSDSRYSGAQVFYSKNHPESSLLANTLQENIRNMLQPGNSRETKQAQKNLYLLYNAGIPAVMVECGFLSNANECKRLENDAYQNKMAFAIYYGTLQFESSRQKRPAAAGLLQTG